MTLKELFCSVDFDAILPIILEYDSQIAGSEMGLKQAFDFIRMITPREEEPKKMIKVQYFNDTDASEGMSVSNCSNDHFDVVAGRCVETVPNLCLTLNELAAYCLWELTYWGFSDEEAIEIFRVDALGRWAEPKNRYEQEYAVKSNRWFPSVSVSVALGLYRKARKKNRLKRKRDYRRKQRLKQLLRYAKIEEFCQYVKVYHVDGVSATDLWSLKNVVGFTVTVDRSFSEQAEGAEQYMCELYEKYGKINPDTVRSIALIIGGGSVNGELDKLRQTLNRFLPNVIIGIGDRLQIPIKVTIINVLSKRYSDD